VSQLDVLDHRAVFVFAFDGSNIHAYLKSMYYKLCQHKYYNSCAYVFGTQTRTRLRKISELRRLRSQNVPITVELGLKPAYKDDERPLLQLHQPQ
jgi:hypothetical protein